MATQSMDLGAHLTSMIRGQCLPLRQLLVRFLMLAVLFNAAAGRPAHEGSHLRQTLAAVATLSASASTSAADPSADGAAHGKALEGACAWCFAYADLGVGLTASAPPHTPAWLDELPRPQPARGFVPSPGHWPFASRDPPAC
ncbi:DUF2946 family protein [Paucibacter sp. DJ2R-2]|uniref:DUF2946 family protein n=1 Tax=Paucibacter sp. DJ2R-2 TaxID=2893558 RepID=UPI0021E4C1F5|nr:DUF2946 family protein [Paucibacter sp. DJ2R-2]MCV2421206.1 hypothetical protein [Paucibacter sp. DJ4R-1]MCV2439184.1 hypothetical protein [Paucibacter sp. DJ2R-2]